MNPISAAAETLRDEKLYGSWRVVRAEGVLVDADGHRTESSSEQEGVLIFTPGHRMIAFVVRPGRTPADNDEDRLELFKSAITYSGHFRLEAGKYLLEIEWSSTALNQDELQVRGYRIEGDTLTITTELHRNIHDPSKQNANTLTLQREP